MIYGAIAPRVKHPIFTEKASVKKYHGAYDVWVKLCFAIVAKPIGILFTTMFSKLFEGRNNTTNIRRIYYRETNFSYVNCWIFGVEKISSLQHNMLLHLVPKGYGMLEFKGGCFGLHALKYYYRLEYDYQEYYHWH